MRRLAAAVAVENAAKHDEAVSIAASHLATVAAETAERERESVETAASHLAETAERERESVETAASHLATVAAANGKLMLWKRAKSRSPLSQVMISRETNVFFRGNLRICGYDCS